MIFEIGPSSRVILISIGPRWGFLFVLAKNILSSRGFRLGLWNLFRILSKLLILDWQFSLVGFFDFPEGHFSVLYSTLVGFHLIFDKGEF